MSERQSLPHLKRADLETHAEPAAVPGSHGVASSPSVSTVFPAKHAAASSSSIAGDVQTFPSSSRSKHEILYNKHLPYSVDAEADRWLLEIKEQLAKCVLETDYRPGVFYWSTRLDSYMDLYGRRFTKEDHVNFIKLFLELMLDPGMEPSLILKFCKMLCALTRKLELLCPEDLTIEWKPLFKLYERIAQAKEQFHGVFYWPDKMEEHVAKLVGYCRYYFPLSATQEMLDEWRPMLCPFDDSMPLAMGYFNTFLPTMLKPANAKFGYELWLEEFIHIWLGFHGVPSWENDMLELFSRVAAENIGYIHWEKYVSAIFTKFLRTLELPVGKKQLQLVFSNESFDSSSAVLWPVAMLHEEACLVALERLFKSVESYFHPSNYGNWTEKLSNSLMLLPMGVVARIQLERFRPKDWMPEIPIEACLSDETIRRFVRAFKPLAFLHLFNKSGTETEFVAIQQLALLAPDEIFPDLLDKFYASVETLTEPQRFQAIMTALVGVLPHIFNYKEGKKHIVPLMVALLPGIDSNDVRKTTATLMIFSVIATMIPLRPCFDKADSADTPEEDQGVCAQTAEFEDIILQLLDKCLALIGNFTVEAGARSEPGRAGAVMETNVEEKVIKVRMEMLWFAIFMRVDDNIMQLLADKLFTTASSQIFPVQQLGAGVISQICAIAMRVRPQIARPTLLHKMLRLLEIRLAERPNYAELTNLDDELLWTMKVVMDQIASAGNSVLDYTDRIRAILRGTLMMQCQTGHRYACIMSRSFLITLLRTYPLNYYAPDSCSEAGCSPLSDWGKRLPIKDVEVKWHVPTPETVAVCSQFFHEFISEPLESLDQYAKGTLALEDKKIQKYLHMLEALFVGVISHCSFDFDSIVPLPGYEVNFPKEELPQMYEGQVEIMLNGKPVRSSLAELLRQVVDRILAGQSDETKSLKSILVLYKVILMSRGTTQEEVLMLATTLGAIKMEMENRLGPKKLRYRALIIEKTRLQHERRTVFQRATRMTATRLLILRDVVRLSVSRYKEVRSTAQTLFHDITSQFNLAYRYVLGDILAYLQDSKNKTTDNDAQLKGCLYLLLGNKGVSYILKHDWYILRKVFPAIVEAQHSENPTVGKLFDALAEKVESMFITTGLILSPCPSANKIAGQILRTMNFELEVIFDHALKLGKAKVEVKNAENVQLYGEMIEDLVRQVSMPQARLKNFLIGIYFISYFVRIDCPPPISLVQFALDHLLDSNDKARRSSVLMMISIMRAIKPKRTKVRIQPCHDLAGKPLPLPSTVGVREDNLWICVDESRVPRNGKEYDDSVFIDKIWPGYYGWPKDGLEVSAPVSQQLLPMERTRDSLTDIERAIFDKLTNEEYVDSLMKFLSAEDFAHSEFDTEIFLTFRAWFRHFREAIVPLFMKHIKNLVKSPEEHQQRAAAEILTALIRGAKRWPYRMVSKLWFELVPVIQTALNSITGETQGDWVAFGTNSIGYGDMRQTYPLLQSVFSISPTDTGFQTTAKLAVIHGIFECSDWRRRDLLYKILHLVESRLTESYRDHIAYLLSVCFRHDLKLPNIEKNVDQGPKASDFFQKYHPQCLELVEKEKEGRTTLPMLIMFKTIVKTIVTHVSSLATLRPDVLKFYPLLCRFENDPRDGDLAKDCIAALTCFSQVFLSENAIPRLLQEVHSVVTSPDMPWRARVVALDNLQVCVFNNLLTIMEKPAWTQEIAALVRDRLFDEQIEVRQMAAVTLTGFIQCNFIPMTDKVAREFRAVANEKLPADRNSSLYGQKLIRRHAGVLGLTACVAAYPYEVPPLVPDILMVLGEHINDPLPINATVRAAFSEFRRTHHDSWREHKEKFSDDQLALLTDLLVSPNYYA